MVSRWILRVLMAPRVLTGRVVDLWVAPWVVRARGARLGRGCRFAGIPWIRMVAGAKISIGNGVLISSRLSANTATMPHPTMLSAVKPGAVIEIGDGVGLSGVSIVAARSVRIGDRALVGSGAVLWDTDFHPLDPAARRRHPTEGARAEPIAVGRDVFIGARAIILKGVTIGDGAVVGAGAVVSADVPPGAVVAGNPARVVRKMGMKRTMTVERAT